MCVITCGADTKVPLTAHGLEAIPDHIVEGLSELITVQRDLWEVLGRKEIDGDPAVLQFTAKKLDGFNDQRIEVRGFAFEGGWANSFQKLRDDLIKAFHLATCRRNGLGQFLLIIPGKRGFLQASF